MYKFIYTNLLFLYLFLYKSFIETFYNNFYIIFMYKCTINFYLTNRIKNLLYFTYINILYHLNHLLNIDEIYIFIKNINFFNNKYYIFDPIHNRYEFIKYSNKFYNLYKSFFIFYKEIILYKIIIINIIFILNIISK